MSDLSTAGGILRKENSVFSIDVDGTGTTIIPITNAGGGSPSFDSSGSFTDGSGNTSTYARMAFAVEKLIDGTFILAIKNTNTWNNSPPQINWEFYAVNSSGVIDTDSQSWTQSAVSWEDRLNQDLDGDGYKGFSELPNLPTDLDISRLKKDKYDALYIDVDGSGTTIIPITDEYGGSLSFDSSESFTDGSGNTSTYARMAFAVEKLIDGTFILAIKNINTWNNSPPQINWEFYAINSSGVIDTDSQSWTQSADSWEERLKQDLDGDGLIGDVTSPSLTWVDQPAPDTIILHFSELLTEDADLKGAIIVNVNGSNTLISTYTWISTAGKSSLEIKLTSNVTAGQQVQVSYDGASKAINDLANNAANGFDYTLGGIYENYTPAPNNIGLTPIIQDSIAAGSWHTLSGNETFRTYFEKLIQGSSYSGESFTAPGLSIRENSISFLGQLNPLESGDSSLSGFNSLTISDDVNLPSGGLFLSSGGSAYQNNNTQGGYSINRRQAGYDQLTSFAKDAYEGSGETYDASILKFTFTPLSATKSLFLDLIFGSDEYYEYLNTSYVDIAAIWFENQTTPRNYADFVGDGTKPLSIITESTNDPRFINNDLYNGPHLNPDPTIGYTPLPIEFDGITKKLTIAIPLDEVSPSSDGSYTINIGISDTGDHILDSAIWISNLRGADFKGDGLFLNTKAPSNTAYILPNQNTSAIIETGEGSVVTPGLKPDIINLPDNATGQSEVTGTIDQLKGDSILSFNNNSKITIEETLDQSQIKITKGSAIVQIDENKDGSFSSNEATFRLEGDYFDVSKFLIANNNGKTTITYFGEVQTQPSSPLSIPQETGVNGGGGSSPSPTAPPLPQIPAPITLGNPPAQPPLVVAPISEQTKSLLLEIFGSPAAPPSKVQFIQAASAIKDDLPSLVASGAISETSAKVLKALADGTAIDSTTQSGRPRTPVKSGSDSEDIIIANTGKGVLQGGERADSFAFIEQDRFGKRGVDRITDFNSQEGDKIIISPTAFPGIQNIQFKTISGRRNLKTALKSEATIIYEEKTGSLYYNGTPGVKGSGLGGLFAILNDRPKIGLDAFDFLDLGSVLN